MQSACFCDWQWDDFTCSPRDNSRCGQLCPPASLPLSCESSCVHDGLSPNSGWTLHSLLRYRLRHSVLEIHPARSPGFKGDSLWDRQTEVVVVGGEEGPSLSRRLSKCWSVATGSWFRVPNNTGAGAKGNTIKSPELNLVWRFTTHHFVLREKPVCVSQ